MAVSGAAGNRFITRPDGARLISTSLANIEKLKDSMMMKFVSRMRAPLMERCLAAVMGIIALGLTSHAGVTVVENVSPGATSWPGTPTISTLANPSSATAAQSFTSGGVTNISQTFTVTGTNYILQQIDLYAGGGTGTGTGNSLVLKLYDLGFQTSPEPSPYGGVTPNETISGCLLGSGNGLSIGYASQANGVLEFDFTGADQVLLQVGHMYAFELNGNSGQTPINWYYRNAGNYYSAGAGYTNKMWMNNGTTYNDFSMAVYATVATNPPTPPSPLTATNTVNWNDQRQRIDGFGASDAWSTSMSTANANLFFSTNTGAGLSLLRCRIPPDGTIPDVSIMQAAISRGASVWATPWTPPTVYKVGGALDGGNFLSGSATNQAYANYLANYVATLKNSYGINLYAISVQNEPDFDTTGYESCIWTGTQIHDFVPYLAGSLTAYGVSSTKIMIPETMHWSADLSYFTVAMNDSAVATNVSIIANHNYDGINSANTATAIPTQINSSYTNTALWETEVCALQGSYSSIYNGVYWAGRIHDFLTVAQASAWHHWWFATGSGDAPNAGLLDYSGYATKRLYVMGNYSRFVRPNYYRIGVVTNQGLAQVSAYKNTNSGAFAIVAINPNPTNSMNLTVNLNNFTNVGSVTPWITSSSLSLSNQSAMAVTNGAFTYTLPGPSVVTFVGQTQPDSPPTDIALSNSSVPENQPAGTAVGTFSTTDPNSGDTFTYTLVSGTGSDDNASFAISGNTLQTAAIFNYQTQNSYSIRVRTTDPYGLWFEEVFTISVIAVPTDISLSNSSVLEAQPAGTTVGTFSTTDPNGSDTFTYTLVAGAGSTDNGSFAISGNTLQTAAVFAYDVQNTYSIRVRSTTQNNQWVEEPFTITVIDVNVPPNTPTNVSPSDGAVNQSLTPTLQASAFSDPNAGDSQTASEWLIQRNSDNALILDSGTDSIDTTNFTVSAGLLDYVTAYTWQVRYQDNHGAWSGYSAATAFSTLAPTLSVTKQAGNVVISWPTNATGFALEYSTDLTTTNWNPVSPDPVILGNLNVVTNGMTNPATFFRLYQP
jgi:O-glycosyl hydrolase